MIHPRSLAILEPAPPHPEWVCTEHQRVIVGDNRCPRCEIEHDSAVAS